MSLQPLYLLADSQLVFWKRQDRPLLEAALDGLARDTPLSAAYIGTSNGDRPQFYGIFEAAVDAIGITDRRMIERRAVKCFAFTAAVSRSSEGGGSGQTPSSYGCWTMTPVIPRGPLMPRRQRRAARPRWPRRCQCRCHPAPQRRGPGAGDRRGKPLPPDGQSGSGWS
jgi:hypothetical protein